MALCIFVACLCMSEYDYRHRDDPICKIYKRRYKINVWLNVMCVLLICAVAMSVVAMPWIPAILAVFGVIYSIVLMYRILKNK